MPTIKRRTQTHVNGYQEVSLDYRIARAAALDAKQVGAKTGRIACPMVEASRSNSAYGQKILAATDKKYLNKWTKAIGINSFGIRIVAYISGPLSSGLKNLIRGRFNDQEINTGFVRAIHNGVETRILEQGEFSQQAMNAFVWSFHPKLQNQEINEKYLYSDAGETLYLNHTMLSKVIAYNKANAKAGKLKTWFGTKLIGFEMDKLLLGILAQDIILNKNQPNETVKAILVRDIYDFYKYGWLPVLVEDKLVAAGLLNLDTPR